MTAIIEPGIPDLVAGPGGWYRGAELSGIDPRRISGFELDAAAVETARAAGYNRILHNVLDLSPADFPHQRCQIYVSLDTGDMLSQGGFIVCDSGILAEL